MPRLLQTEEIDRQLSDLPGWHVLRGALHARYDAPDVPAAVALVVDVMEAAEEMDHHPDVDLRRRRVRFELATHSEGGVTQLDVELAHRVVAAAARLGADPADDVPTSLQVAVDTPDPAALRDVWAAALGGATSGGEDDVVRVEHGDLPTTWFQTSPPRPGRSRLHLDVYVPRALARRRVDDVLAAGGTLVTDEHAPAWWVVADADGNELCVCTDADDPAGG